MTNKTVLFVDAEVDLFQTCYGDENAWGDCKLESVPTDCDPSQFTLLLQSTSNLIAIVFDDERTKHFDALKQYYQDGGFLVFFGIMGEFQAPYRITTQLGFAWGFSAYTRHEYVLTAKAIAHLGDAVTEQQYTKSNLIRAPEEDRWMVPKVLAMEEYLVEYCGMESGEDEGLCEEDLEEMRRARDGYPEHCDGLYRQCPLAVHEGDNGGRFAYLGFVNGEGNIPIIVRGLILGEKI